MLFQRVFWLNLAGACLVAVIAATPILMSGVMDRGFEIAKLSLAQPLTILAFGAILLCGRWREVIQLRMTTKAAIVSLATFLLLAGISVFLSDMPGTALFGGYYRREGWIAWCVYGAFFFAVLGWARSTLSVQAFIDVLLLTSVIPAVYALQQRLDLDFYEVFQRELARPGSTLGSPVFLAAYLGLLLPITVVRCWQARREPLRLALWLAVALLQTCGLLLTQTRGPLLAVMTGVLLLVCFAAGYARAVRFFWGAGIAVVATASVLIAINVPSGIQSKVRDTPVINRLIFNLDDGTGSPTARASRSASARLGVWDAGAATFAAAPLQRQLFGFGPESAYLHYFPHLPAAVMRMDGYRASNTYDRLHADILDIGLNFGVLGWLAYCFFFSAVIYSAACALFGLPEGRLLWLFVGLMLGGGALSSVAAVQAGLDSAAVPAFGLGVSGGWFVFLVGCAWRAFRHGGSRMAHVQPGDWALLAGLTSALVVFWSDAQVNIPVLTTRLISFAVAALILVIADETMHRTCDAPRLGRNNADMVWSLGVGCALVGAFASVLPDAFLDAKTQAQVMQRWWLRTVPVLAFLLVVALAMWVKVRTIRGVSHRLVWGWLAFALGLPALYAACHLALMVKLGEQLNLSDVARISIVSAGGPLFIAGMCIMFATLASRRVAVANPQSLSHLARLSILAVAAAVTLAAFLAWQSTNADVASKLAQWTEGKAPDVSEQLVGEAIRIMPYEQHYQRQLTFDLLGRAVADIRRLDEAPDRYAAVERNLALAEVQARETLKLFPRDAWAVMALANVLQVRSLRLLRPFDAAVGDAAAHESHRLFQTAHKMFPAQPLLLRNWAQLLFDQGNVADAFQLLNMMEKLIPNEIEPYAERIIMARQVHDSEGISSTLARARLRLPPDLFRRLQIVATEQQN